MYGGSDLPRLAHRRGAERHAATEPGQIRPSAPQDDKAIAEAFAQQAYTAVGNRDREIMRDPYLLGFEIVTKNEENTRLVGVFAFRVSGEILLVPVFYLNGQIKGQDLLYRKGVNRFCPNTDKWVAYLLSRSEDSDGRGINRQGPDARIHLNINQLAGQHLGFKTASQVKSAAAAFDGIFMALGVEEQELDKFAGFVGRYLATGEEAPSIMANKQRIMEELDPDGSRGEERLILSPEEFKQQRQLAYDHMRQHLNRQSAGSYGANAALGGVLGGLVGSAAGAAHGYVGGDGGEALMGAGIGAGVGVPTGALLGMLARAWSKKKSQLISDEDIAAMKEQKKDRGMLSELVSGRDIYDAAAAGNRKAASLFEGVWNDLEDSGPQ